MPQEAADMTAIVLPDIDRSTIDEMKKRFPDLSEFELSLPTRGDVRKTAKDITRTADATIDRLLGRRRAPLWPWIAAGIGLAAIVGVVAAWFAWFRRPTWEREPEQSEPWSATVDEVAQTTVAEPPEAALDALDIAPTRAATRTSGSRAATGRTATTSASSASMPYPIEEA
jgi:hypothetical protein